MALGCSFIGTKSFVLVIMKLRWRIRTGWGRFGRLKEEFRDWYHSERPQADTGPFGRKEQVHKFHVGERIASVVVSVFSDTKGLHINDKLHFPLATNNF